MSIKPIQASFCKESCKVYLVYALRAPEFDFVPQLELAWYNVVYYSLLVTAQPLV